MVFFSHIILRGLLLLSGLFIFIVQVPGQNADSLKSIFMDPSENAQNRIHIGSQLVKEVTVVTDNLTINEQTEHLILANTSSDTYTTNLQHLFDLLVMRSVLYKMGQNNDKALESLIAAQSVAQTLNDNPLLLFAKQSELHQQLSSSNADSLIDANLNLYKLFNTQKKTLLAGLCLQNAADLCFLKKNYADALNYYKKSLSLQNVNHNKLISALLNTQIGQTYLAMGSNELALSYFDIAYQFHLFEGNLQEQAINLYYTAKAHFNKGNTKVAEEIINKVRQVTSQLEDSYFKKLIVVQLSFLDNLKQEEKLSHLFADTLNLLNSASVLPASNKNPAADDVYLNNIKLMQKQSADKANANKPKGEGLLWLYILGAGVLGSIAFFVLRFIKTKNS